MSRGVQLDSAGRPVPILEDTSTDTGPVDVRTLEVVAPPQMQSAPPVPQRAPTKAPAKAPTARDMVRDIRARLREVNAQIRARNGLEAEREKLQRLLNAALQKPASVRAIRSAG